MKPKVDDGTTEKLLSELVAIDSVNPVYGGPGEAKVADFVESWLGDSGIVCERQSVFAGRDNLFARVGPEGVPAVLVEAHMDTVGVGGWAMGDPFELTPQGGRLYGRGSCDTKASLAVFMTLAAWMQRNHSRAKRALVFAATVDEESEQLGAYEIAKLKERFDIRWAITGEPTLSDVVSRHKGVGRYCLSVPGKAAHGSTPELGENAIYKAARICQKLEALASELDRKAHGFMEKGTLNLGVVSGGVGFNVVPDRCVLDIDRRFGVTETAIEARRELEAICETERGASLEVFLERPALTGEGAAGFVAGFRAAAATVGENIADRSVPYMTNAVAYESVGIPSIVFGPGDIAQAHKVDEFIESGEMERSLRILKAFCESVL